jgi:hypothetical protein
MDSPETITRQETDMKRAQELFFIFTVGMIAIGLLGAIIILS